MTDDSRALVLFHVAIFMAKKKQYSNPKDPDVFGIEAVSDASPPPQTADDDGDDTPAGEPYEEMTMNIHGIHFSDPAYHFGNGT